MKWGLIGAMEEEIAALLSAMTDVVSETVAGRAYYSGKLGDADVVLTQCGVGKVCAAMAAQILIDRYHVDALVNTGVAGGLAKELQVGDIVLSESALHHDFDITAFGHVRGYIGGGGDDTVPTRFYADRALIDRFMKGAENKTGHRVLCGTVASGDVFVDDTALKLKIRDEFDATVAEMEGAAVAQVATANGVPFLIVREVSDLAENDAAGCSDNFLEKAARRSAKLLIAMVNV